MKKIFFALMIVCIGFNASCEKKASVSDAVHNPNIPIKLSSFTPDSGGARSQMVIEGVNFGSDTSLIRVSFSEKKIPATVISANGNYIYCLVPPGQPDGRNAIYVNVGKKKDSLVVNKFRYTIREQVSLVTGQPDKGGDTDGTLSTALFPRLFTAFPVDGDGLFIFGNGNPRLVSLRDNAVVTLQSGVRILNGCMSKDRKTVYGVSLHRPHALFKYTKENLWMPELVAASINIDKDLFACTLDDTEEWIYFYVPENAGLWRLNIADPSRVEMLSDRVGTPTGYWGGIAYSKVENCFYVASFDLSGIYKVSKDGSVVENFAGFKGHQYKDGLARDSGTPNPAGILVDGGGNIYFTEVRKRTVRRIDYRTKMVTTIAGQVDVWGDKDGPPKEATFRQPYGIGMDAENNIYITSSEDGFGTIRKLAIE